MPSVRTDRMARSERLYRKLDDFYLRREQLEAQIKVLNQEYQRALGEEERARSAEEAARGK